MKRKTRPLFPPIFALFTALIYRLLASQPKWDGDIITLVLVFFTALAWSSPVFFYGPVKEIANRAYIAAALIAPLFLIPYWRSSPGRLPHLLEYLFLILGLIVIRFYISGQDKSSV